MRARRHGDPLQTWIQKKTLRPLLLYIRRLVKRDTTGKVEAVATQLWQNLREHVEEVVADTENGRMVPRWTARGARLLLEALSQSTPVECACAAGALFLLREREPWRFVSEDGWRAEFVRAWRKQVSITAFGSYWDQRQNGGRGGAKPVYKELPLRVVQEIGLLLLTTYTPFAARVIRLDQRKRQVDQAVRQALDEGFASIAGK
jgi:hypothetical protein